MDASSTMEEDIMEICIRRAHAHPFGVLQYSVAESVVLFGNLKDVNCAHHTLPDMIELCDEAITVWTMAPTEAHVAAFTTIWHLNPTSGYGELHTPPNKHLQVRRHCAISMLSLETLMTVSSQQLIKDLSQELVQCKLTVPPSNPLLMTGYIHWAVESLRKMTGRSPFQEGEGGVQRGKPPQF